MGSGLDFRNFPCRLAKHVKMRPDPIICRSITWFRLARLGFQLVLVQLDQPVAWLGQLSGVPAAGVAFEG